MSSQTALTLSILLLVLLFLSLLFAMLWVQKQTSQRFLEVQEKRDQQVTALMDKMMGMLGTKDPLAFQAVQAMTYSQNDPVSPFEQNDPSDEAEYDKWAKERGLDDLDGTILESLGWIPGASSNGING